MTPIDAILLAGGRSSRMGQDKAALLVDGRRLVDRAIGALSPLGGRILIARGDRPSLDLADEVPDAAGMSGPVAGVVGAAALVTTQAVAIVAVDMPTISAAVLRRLAVVVEDNSRSAAMPVVDGIAQPMHAVVSAAALPAMVALAHEGEGSLRRMLARLDAILVGPDGWADLDAHARFVVDWDRPADLPSGVGAPR